MTCDDIHSCRSFHHHSPFSLPSLCRFLMLRIFTTVMIIFSHRFPAVFIFHPLYPSLTPLGHLLRHLDDQETELYLRADPFAHSCTIFHEAFCVSLREPLSILVLFFFSSHQCFIGTFLFTTIRLHTFFLLTLLAGRSGCILLWTSCALVLNGHGSNGTTYFFFAARQRRPCHRMLLPTVCEICETTWLREEDLKRLLIKQNKLGASTNATTPLGNNRSSHHQFPKYYLPVSQDGFSRLNDDSERRMRTWLLP